MSLKMIAKWGAPWLLLAWAGLAQGADSLSEAQRQAIEARIQPVGQLYIEGDQPATAQAGGERSGEVVYQKACFACHATGMLNAPKPHTDDWQPRLAKGMDTLVQHALNGFNAMPPKGACPDCSEAELRAAIEFMSAK